MYVNYWRDRPILGSNHWVVTCRFPLLFRIACNESSWLIPGTYEE